MTSTAMSNQIDISGVDPNLIHQLQQQQMYNSLNARQSMSSRIIEQDDMSDDDDDDEDVMNYTAMLGKKYNKGRTRKQLINIAQIIRQYMEYQQEIQDLKNELMDKNEDYKQMTQIIQEQERKIEDYQHEIELKDAKIIELEEESEADQDYIQELEMEINQILYQQNNNKNDIEISPSVQIPIIDDGDNNNNDDIYDIDHDYNNEAEIAPLSSIITKEPIQIQTAAMNVSSPQPPNDLSGDLKQESIEINTNDQLPHDPDDLNWIFSDDRDTNIDQDDSSDDTDNDDEIEQELVVNIHPVHGDHAHNLNNIDNNNNNPINDDDDILNEEEDEHQNTAMPNPYNNRTDTASSSLIPSFLTSNNSFSRTSPHQYNKNDTMFSDAGDRHYHLDVLPQIIQRLEHNIQSQQFQNIDPYIFAAFIISLWRTCNTMIMYSLLLNLYQKKP